MIYTWFMVLTIIFKTLFVLKALRHLTTFEDRIIGGDFTVIQHVPYLINLRQNGQFKCGGSIVTTKCILTAAHCVHQVPATKFTIHAGSSYLSDPHSIVRQVQHIFVPLTYSPETLDMDVAILKLNQSLNMSPATSIIKAIPLCSRRPNDNSSVQIIGWGVTNENSQNPSEQVQTVMVTVLPMKDCIAAYGKQAQITTTMFCASVPGEKDSCSGDSGGPLIYGNEICGIVSWGFGCARPQYPGVYTNIASLRVNAYIKTILIHNCL